MAEKVDVLICGSGSAGLCAALWLSLYGISYRVIEKRPGPLEIGQADGVQTRTVEIFDAFNIAEPLLRDSYHVLEIAFWVSPNHDGTIRRSHFAADKETAISHQPHVILNQARLNEIIIDEIRRVGEFPVEYGTEVKTVEVDAELAADPEAYAVRVTAEQGGVAKEYAAKYVLGCDGAHSTVRKALGFKMLGDTSDSVWGVMDVYPLTDFPDIRKKAVIHADAGNLMIIPREGDSMVRFYLELPTGTKVKDVSLESLQAHARKVFSPYRMEIAETAWWSAYAIGQRRADFFTKSHRAFLTGDACHTHSPKAGQGMNVSLQDGYNIGWKLGAVLTGQSPASLLETYVSERESTATELIEFDRYFTQLFSSKYRAANGITSEQFAEGFVKSGRYTAGQAVKYDQSAIISLNPESKTLAANVDIGMRLPTAQVVRWSDAKAVQLPKLLPSVGRWYVVIFAGDINDAAAAARLEKTAAGLKAVAEQHTPAGADPDSLIDPVLVLSGKRTSVSQEAIPEFFTPVTGKWKMKSLHKVVFDDESYNSGHGHAYEAYGVDPAVGALIIVRPDQYTAKVTTVADVEGVASFFQGFLNKVR
ncbi:FAD binding domain-containing protein [Coniochaeta sp. 2T2.1]|nr:FAD binding domain-containing protein [Coniochaeta sp. 2T2.1]